MGILPAYPRVAFALAQSSLSLGTVDYAKSGGTIMAGGSKHSHILWLLLSAAILLLATPANRAFTVPPPPAVSNNSFQSLDDILHYISDDWSGLKRSLTDCNTYQDVKTKGKPTLYLPADVSTSPAWLKCSSAATCR